MRHYKSCQVITCFFDNQGVTQFKIDGIVGLDYYRLRGLLSNPQ